MSDNGINLNWRGGLEDLVKELDRQKKAKVDFIADARSIRVRPADVQDGCGVEIHSPARSGSSSPVVLGSPIGRSASSGTASPPRSR